MTSYTRSIEIIDVEQTKFRRVQVGQRERFMDQIFYVCKLELWQPNSANSLNMSFLTLSSW